MKKGKNGVKVGDIVEATSKFSDFNSGDRFVVDWIDKDGDPRDKYHSWTPFFRIIQSASNIEALKDAVIKAAVNFRHRRFIFTSWEDFVQAVDELEAATKPEPKPIPVMWAGKDHPDFAGEA